MVTIRRNRQFKPSARSFGLGKAARGDGRTLVVSVREGGRDSGSPSRRVQPVTAISEQRLSSSQIVQGGPPPTNIGSAGKNRVWVRDKNGNWNSTPLKIFNAKVKALELERRGLTKTPQQAAVVKKVVKEVAERGLALRQKAKVAKPKVTKVKRQDFIERAERPFGAAQKLTISQLKAQQKAVPKKSVVQKIDELRRKPFKTFQEKLRTSSDVGEFVRQQKRLGKKITGKERAALVTAGFTTAGIRALRGVSTVVLTPDEVVKGAAQFGVDGVKSVANLRPVGSVQGMIDEFTRDPVGTFIEFFAAKKVIGAGLKGAGKITKTVGSKTKLGRQASVAAKSTATKLKTVARKVPGIKQAAKLSRAADKLKRAAGQRVLKNKVINRVNTVVKRLGKKVTQPRKKPNVSEAREIIRKIEINKKALKQARLNKKVSIKAFKKAKASKSFVKNQNVKFNRQISSLKKGAISLNKRLIKTRVSPAKRAILRREVTKKVKTKVVKKVAREIKTDIKAKIPKSKLSRLDRLSKTKTGVKKIIKGLKSGKIKAADLPKRVRSKIIKQFKKSKLTETELSRRKLLTKIRKEAKARDARDIKKSQDIIKQTKKDVATKKPLSTLEKDFKKVESQIKVIKKDKVNVKKKSNAFSSKSRLNELKKLNQADKALQKAEGNIQGQAQKTIQIVEKTKVKTLVDQVKKIENGKTSILEAIKKSKTKLGKKKGIIKFQKQLKKSKIARAKLRTVQKTAVRNVNTANKFRLGAAGKLAKTALAIGALIRRLPKVDARQDAKRLADVKTDAKPKTKQITKPKQAQDIKTKPETVTIPTVDVASLPATKQAQIVSQLLATAAATQFVNIGGRNFKVKTPKTKAGFAALRRRTQRFIKSRRFVFIPDLFSIIFGIRAKPKRRVKLLRTGRVFTGAEARPIVRV